MSTSAYIGSADTQFNKIDGTDQGTFPGAKSSSHGRLQSCCRVVGNIILALYFLLLTAVAVIAFILGSYATSRVRKSPDAVLVSDPTTAPGPGYSVFSLGTGLGYWSPTTDMLHTRSDHGVRRLRFDTLSLSPSVLVTEPHVAKARSSSLNLDPRQ